VVFPPCRGSEVEDALAQEPSVWLPLLRARILIQIDLAAVLPAWMGVWHGLQLSINESSSRRSFHRTSGVPVHLTGVDGPRQRWMEERGKQRNWRLYADFWTTMDGSGLGTTNLKTV
jgi:hypothetical protein